MKNFARAALLAAMAATPASADSYKIDSTHSFVEFRIQHLGYSWMLGRFNDLSGDFVYAPDKGEADQSIRMTVSSASVDTNHAERDKHLRSSDFLNTDAFPLATFTSTGFSGDDSGGVMRGELTIHGVTREVDVEVQKIGAGDDPWGGYRAGFSGKLVFKRSDFGMDYNLGPQSESLLLEVFVEGVRE